MSAQLYSRADRARRRRGCPERIRPSIQPQMRRDGSVVPLAITAEATERAGARRRRLARLYRIRWRYETGELDGFSSYILPFDEAMRQQQAHQRLHPMLEHWIEPGSTT